MEKRSAIISPDGFLDLPKDPKLVMNEEYGAPAFQGEMIVPGPQDAASVAIARKLDEEDRIEIAGKSGGSRVGLELIRGQGDIRFEAHRIIVPVEVISLREVEVRKNGRDDQLLFTLEEMVRERAVNIGRIILADPQDALSREEVIHAFERHRLALPEGKDPGEYVDGQGHLMLPLEQLRYVLCEDNLNHWDQMRSVIRFGKHGLADVQEPREGLPEEIRGKQFFVGAIRLSIGPYIGIIDAETNKSGLVHLAARILDGIRTTGVDFPRQVELFNKMYEAMTTEDIRIRIRLHHASRSTQEFAKSIINKRTIADGVSLPDVIELNTHPERIFDLMHLVHPSIADGETAGYFVGSGRAHKVSWVHEASPHFQGRHLAIIAPRFAAEDPEYTAGVREIPEAAAKLARVLGYVGQDQSHSKIYSQWGFPDTDVMKEMHNSGIGVFIAHDVRERPDTYGRKEPFLTRKRQARMLRDDGSIEEGPIPNDVFLDDQRFSSMQKLHADGVRFLLVRHEAKDHFGETDTMPEEVLVWHERGFWVRPEARERVEKVDTLIAMYGSHVEGMDEVLKDQLTRFACRMKNLFGEHVGFIHGKGPGVMHMVDYIARHLPELAQKYPEYEDEIKEAIVSIGVGIDLEQQDQAINHHPDAQVDFGAQHRLVRQKHMNDRMSFNIFNLGGAGTLEEVAVSLCSQKLYKNVMTPLILVDPIGISREGDNFWSKLVKFIEDMASKKEIDAHAAAEGKVNIRLMKEHMKNLIHVVNDYDQAADIIERFILDPVGYYTESGVSKQEFVTAYDSAGAVRLNTKFPMPYWMDIEKFSVMLEYFR
ncbi:hypothetical protein COU76_05755 [Candidatus Peregrinibacteria bacterium CG10_big_fil_rev_8_21_14_0_10_49_10]|nr:MAG: hypothetical protein COU76_05755 [Candidatus Peregrinibacteria bacterium CG10_big_fil_rev_8_21_14_0_10_49_10]